MIKDYLNVTYLSSKEYVTERAHLLHIKETIKKTHNLSKRKKVKGKEKYQRMVVRNGDL